MVAIYKITNPSGRIYIGQTWSIRNRKSNYKIYGARNQVILEMSIKKYGWQNHIFEVIHQLPNDVTQDVLDTYEKLYIELYKSCNVAMMNIREGGSRGKHSESTKEKMSIAAKGRIIPESEKQRLRTLNIGRPQTEEMRRKNSEWQKKKKLTSEHKEKIRQSLLGHKPSDLTRQLWSKQRSGIRRKRNNEW